jgi:ureidoglycolate dehydrogenase (NAD+)
MSEQALRVPEDRLAAFASAVLRHAGLAAEAAERVADVLVWADLRGTPSHGVSRLPLYTQWLHSGEMNGAAVVRPALTLPAVTILEGDCCAGALGMSVAAEEAMKLASRAGLGMALLRATTHTGALGYYTSAIADAGMAGIALAASGPNMAYHHAAAAGVSTSPLSIAVPHGPGKAPVVFDMSTAVAALGKLMQARPRGEPLPEGWAADAAGRPTTDPQRAQLPLPLGGAKGSGLALMIETLASLLAGHPILAPMLALPAGRRVHYQNGLVIAIDIAQLRGTGEFEAEMNALVAALKGLPSVDGQEILLPGERGSRESALRFEAGIPISPPTRAALDALASEFHVVVPWSA